MGAYDGFMNKQKEQKIERNLENNVVAIIFTGKACSHFTVFNVEKTVPYCFRL